MTKGDLEQIIIDVATKLGVTLPPEALRGALVEAEREAARFGWEAMPGLVAFVEGVARRTADAARLAVAAVATAVGAAEKPSPAKLKKSVVAKVRAAISKKG